MSRAVGSLLSGPGRREVASGSATISVTSGARARRSRGRTVQSTVTPSALESAKEVVEEPERWLIAPVKVVDRDHQRAVRREADREPVKRVQHRERGVRRSVSIRGAWRSGQDLARGGRRAPGRPQALGAGRTLEQLAHHPKGELTLELLARATRTRAPASCARPLASARSRVLPMPAGPSITTNADRPRAASGSAASRTARSRSRSTSEPPARVQRAGPLLSDLPAKQDPVARATARAGPAARRTIPRAPSR
jgi:hypothetical protein